MWCLDRACDDGELFEDSAPADIEILGSVGGIGMSAPSTGTGCAVGGESLTV